MGAVWNRWLLGDEMGLGKTAEAIEVMKRLGQECFLIVCPALARPGWVKQIRKWWPEREGDVCMIDMSPKRKHQSKKRLAAWPELLARPIRIVSPELLDYARERAFLGVKSPLLVDEIHMLANPATKRSGVLRSFAAQHKGPILGLSATPIPNKIKGLFNIVDTIWHRRFGRGDGKRIGYDFCKYYLQELYNEFGIEWGGLRGDRADNLRERLSHMMSRTTRAEVADKIPPCQIKPLTVPPGTKLDKLMQDWLAGAMEEASHVAVLTHLRATAKHYATLFANCGRPVLHVDGDVPTTRRMALVDSLREQPNGILVSTMHAVSESISLSWCHRNILAELYWSPKVLTQVIGRFPRLDGTVPTVLEVLCGANTVQERMAASVSDKLWQLSQVTQQGASESGLSSALSDNMSIEQMIEDAAFSICTEAELEALTSMETEV